MSNTIGRAALELAIDGGAELQKTLGQINRELNQSQAELGVFI